jgi:hypothetical protein
MPPKKAAKKSMSKTAAQKHLAAASRRASVLYHKPGNRSTFQALVKREYKGGK